LALWQANKVRKELEELGYETQIVPIKSTGDLILDKPLYELGITGVFTKNLDIAMLNKEIGSLRRTAQWLHRYPTHKVVDLRGNVNTRLQKLEDNDWNGAIFAAAGLERIGLRPKGAINLSWMTPAPAHS